MALRRGFKTEANWYARQMRRELQLAPHEPLCPWKLAKHLEFLVVPISAYSGNQPKAVAYFQSGAGVSEFSAVTIPIDEGLLVIHNDKHHPNRQAANIAHEVAHGLLIHPLAPLRSSGGRHYDRACEEEANWLGPALLISDEAAIYIVENRMNLAQAAHSYGVSRELLQMRINVSGAAIRVNRKRAA